jgi:Trk K+ transport system NAD-binding subunit
MSPYREQNTKMVAALSTRGAEEVRARVAAKGHRRGAPGIAHAEKRPLHRRILAHALYLRRPLKSFLPVLATVVVILLLGGWAFSEFYSSPDYDGKGIGYLRGVYLTLSLMYAESPLPFPDHPLLGFMYFVLPLAGLAVVLDAVVRFSYHILRRDETGRDWVSAVTSTMKNHVLLFGIGKVGLRVLQQLLALGEQVVVIEKNPNNANLAYARQHGVTVMVGDGRQAGIMLDLNVKDAKSVILATDDDLANLEVAIDAREVCPTIRVVMRMFDHELATKIKGAFDIHLAFSTAAIAAPLFATASSDRSIVSSFYVGENLLVVAELMINPDSKLAGTEIRSLGRESHVFIIGHTPAGGESMLFPEATTVFRPGDRITVQTTPARLRDLHVRNADPEPW